MITRHGRMGHRSVGRSTRGRRKPEGRSARRLRIESLERREMLAVASIDGGLVTYRAASGETNDITLSPGEVFSIQDAPDVQQHGEDGFQASNFLSALGYSIDFGIGFDVSADVSFGIGAETGVGVGVGFSIGTGIGIPFIQDKLPDGLIGPSPPLNGGSSASGLGSYFASALQQSSQGNSSAVAGAEVTEDGKVFYKVEAASGTVDEYRLYQAIVDPSAAVDETADNDTYLKAQTIPAGTLIQGSFAASPAEDVDYYRFDATAADVGKKLVVILDNDPHKVLSDSDSSNDAEAASSEIQVLYSSYPFVKPTLVASTTSFSDGTALGPLMITRPGTYFISMADKSLREHSAPTDYRFVLVEADTARPHGEVVHKVSTLKPFMRIEDQTTQTSEMTVNLGAEATISDISIALQIVHSYDSDLKASLVSPSGTRIQLFRKVGDDDNNFGSAWNPNVSTWTVFSDDADMDIADGKAPFIGSYRPMGALANFRGEDANGVWKLEITDSVNNDEGYLYGWQLQLDVESPVYVHEAAPNAAIVDNTPLESTLDVADEGFHSIVTSAVQLNLTHDENDDLTVALESPSGTTVDLFQGIGGAASGAIDVTLDDYATQNIQGPTTVPGPSGSISDDNAANYYPITVSDFNGTVTGLEVSLDITHPNDSDLVVSLVSPTGGELLLFSGVGGTGDNFTDTVLADSAAVDIGSGAAPFTGTFKPQGALASFIGADPNGVWKLKVVDTTGGNAGTLNSWSLTFAEPSTPFSGRYRPAGSLSALTGEDPTGTWKLKVLDGDGNGKEGTLLDWSLTLSGEGAKQLALTDEYGKGRIYSQSQQDVYYVSDASIHAGDLVFAFVNTADTDNFRAQEDDSKLTVLAANGLDEIGFDDNDGPPPQRVEQDSDGNIIGSGSSFDLDSASQMLEDAGIDLYGMFASTDGIKVEAGDGNDTINASKLSVDGTALIDGGDGNDTILAPGGDAVTLNGGNGDDIFVFNNSFATVGSIDGGAGGNNIIEIDEPTGNLNIILKFDGSHLDVTVGEVTSSYLVANIQTIAINGGYLLSVEDVGDGDCTIWRQGADGLSGSINIGSLAQISYTGIPHVAVVPIDPVTDGYGADGMGRVVVFPADPMEDNNSRRVATDFATLMASHVRPTIDPEDNGASDFPQDEDWYRYVASETGTFCFKLDYEPIDALSNGNDGLPGDGKLKITAYDSDGNAVAKILGEGDSSHTIGVEAGRTYYVRVQGATADAVNVYDIDLVDVDIYGPQVTDVRITGEDDYDFFTQKEADAGLAPTPLVYSISVSVEDAVPRRPDYLYPAVNEAVGENPGHYLLVGDANGVIAIDHVDVVNDPVVAGSTATATILLVFSSPLPDDRYTLTIADDVTDPAGNGFDGESNTLEPQADPEFPTGDNVSGGDFAARFTVDSRPEIGVWTSGSIYVDINGNFQYDTTTTDATNRDYAYSLGYTSDVILAGNFSATAADTADGFSKLAAYGKLGKTYRWLIDLNSDGVTDIFQTDPAKIVGVPLAGDFDGNADNGDEVGLFNGKTWYLDVSHDYMVHNSASDLTITNGLKGIPVVGDFDGDTKVDLATYNAGKFTFDLASNGYGTLDATIDVGYLNYAGARLKPVAADMDMDGITDIGLWCPDRAGADSTKVGEWYFLVSDDPTGTLRTTGTVNRLDHSFSLLAPSKDIFARLGSQYSVPVVGNFDPPVADDHGNVVASTDTVTVSLVGTSRSERFAVEPGTEPGTWIVMLDGKSQTLEADSLNLSIDGGGGRDALTLTATAGSDQIECSPETATVTGDGYTISVRDVETILIDAGGGDNSATLHGSSRNDKLKASATTAILTGSGYSLTVYGVGSVVVDGAGGKDTATLTGTSGNDTFFASLGAASLSGDGYAIGLTGFQTVKVSAGSGGLDTATLVGSTGNDKLTASDKSSKLSGKGFLFQATGFDIVSVEGGGGSDTASVSGGVLEGPLSADLIGSLPDPYRTALWLSDFSTIRHKGKKVTPSAADEVFGVFWN